MRNGLSALMGLVVLGAAASSSTNAASVRIAFDGTDGQTSSLWWTPGVGWGGGGASGHQNKNTGSQPGYVVYSRPTADWYFPISLFKFNMPADMVGATINSATFTSKDTDYNGCLWTGVEIHPLTGPAWVPGNGTRAGRWGGNDNGVGAWFANYDVATDTGTTWGGVVTNMAGAVGVSRIDQTAFGPTAASGNLNGDGGWTSFDVTGMVQAWANGASNTGFALSLMNAAVDGLAADKSGVSTTLLESVALDKHGGLVINYTPVPEPALIGVLVGGSLVMLRQRRRTA